MFTEAVGERRCGGKMAFIVVKAVPASSKPPTGNGVGIFPG